MPRTKQTFRQKTPSRDEVAQALVVASVKMHHDIAPSTPDLSAERCASLVDWIGKAHGGELFLRPVDWQGLGLHDYLSIIQHPIDLSAVSRYCRSDGFEFAGFQDMIRLVWANACRYNPSGTFVHNLARRLAALTEDVIIDAQEHPVDDEKARVSNVYFPVVSTLLQCHVFAPFVAAVEPDLAPGYSDIVRRPMCLDEIASKLEKCEYCSRYDVERDVILVSTNAAEYNPSEHPYFQLSSDLRLRATRLMDAARPDMEEKYMVTSEMRLQLSDNILALSNPRRLELMNLLDTVCPDSIEDELFEGQSSRSICIDALTLKPFIRIDMQVRRWLVADEEEEEEEGEEERERQDDAEAGGTEEGPPTKRARPGILSSGESDVPSR